MWQTRRRLWRSRPPPTTPPLANCETAADRWETARLTVPSLGTVPVARAILLRTKPCTPPRERVGPRGQGVVGVRLGKGFNPEQEAYRAQYPANEILGAA